MAMSTARPPEDEIENTVKRYANRLFKLCFTMLCNHCDAEDAVSNTFLKYITNSPVFDSEEHKKAWLIRVAVNICKDMHRFYARHTTVQLEDAVFFVKDEPSKEILEDVLRLPDKYKTVIHLYYVEGYQTKEIAKILSISPAAVRKRLQYARDLLKLEYRKEDIR